MAVVKAKSKIDSRKVICKEKTINLTAKQAQAISDKSNKEWSDPKTKIELVNVLIERIKNLATHGWYEMGLKNYQKWLLGKASQTPEGIKLIHEAFLILRSKGFKIKYEDKKTTVVISWKYPDCW